MLEGDREGNYLISTSWGFVSRLFKRFNLKVVKMRLPAPFIIKTWLEKKLKRKKKGKEEMWQPNF